MSSVGFAIYLAARLAGPCSGTAADATAEPAAPSRMRWPLRVTRADPADTSAAGMPRGDKPPERLDRHVPSGLGWPGGSAGRTIGRSG